MVERREEEESKAVDRVSELLTAVNVEGKDAQVLVTLLQGKAPVSRATVLQAVGFAFVLTRPPCCKFGVPASLRTFSSMEAKRSYVNAMGKAVTSAFGEFGGSYEELLTALLEDMTPIRLLARSVPCGGTPVLPMEGTEASSLEDVPSRM